MRPCNVTNVVSLATVTTPEDVLTADTAEPEVLIWAVAERSYWLTASPTLKCLAIAAGTVNAVAEPADVR